MKYVFRLLCLGFASAGQWYSVQLQTICRVDPSYSGWTLHMLVPTNPVLYAYALALWTMQCSVRIPTNFKQFSLFFDTKVFVFFGLKVGHVFAYSTPSEILPDSVKMLYRVSSALLYRSWSGAKTLPLSALCGSRFASFFANLSAFSLLSMSLWLRDPTRVLLCFPLLVLVACSVECCLTIYTNPHPLSFLCSSSVLLLRIASSRV